MVHNTTYATYCMRTTSVMTTGTSDTPESCVGHTIATTRQKQNRNSERLLKEQWNIAPSTARPWNVTSCMSYILTN